MNNKFYKSIVTGLLLLLCIGGVHGAVITVDNVMLVAGEPGTARVVLDEVPTGFAGYKVEVTLEQSSTAIIDVAFPTWAQLNSLDPDIATTPSASVIVTAVDLQKKIEAGMRDIELFQMTLLSSDGNLNQIKMNVKELTDDVGSPVPVMVIGGSISDPSAPTVPTVIPTTNVTTTPTVAPTSNVTITPTGTETITPTVTPTGTETTTPTITPIETITPTVTPTGTETTTPTVTPTETPTITPNETPTIAPNETPTPAPEPLDAAFMADKTFGVAPITIHFEDLSTGDPETFFWNFGDGDDAISVAQNPQYTYRKPGTYNVTLTVSKGGETSTTTLDTNIVIAMPRPIPVPRINGILSIGSIPQGADIYLNGAYYGQTPIRIPNLTPHTYQVRLKMPGYYDSVTTIPVWTGPMPSYAAAILLKAVPPNVGKVAADPPQTGSAYIVTYPEGVDVYFEEHYAGISDLMITKIPVGSYNITLKREGFADWPGKIDILVGKTVMQVFHYEQPVYVPVESEYFNEPDIAEGDEAEVTEGDETEIIEGDE